MILDDGCGLGVRDQSRAYVQKTLCEIVTVAYADSVERLHTNPARHKREFESHFPHKNGAWREHT